MVLKKKCISCGKSKPLHLFAEGSNKCLVCKERKKCWNDNYRNKDIKSYILKSAENNAKRRKIEFNLTKEDIDIPNFCPILGIRIEYSSKRGERTPSIDRIDNTMGYIRGNIKVISDRANRLKSDASFAEVKAIYEYMKNN